MGVCLAIFVVCGKYLLDYFIDSYDNKQTYEAVIEIGFPDTDQDPDEVETDADPFDYQALYNKNQDCIGWLRIDGTGIDYPIVQTSDNSFYLTHDFNKDYAICGTPFLDYRNDLSAGKEHLIIYGHQMKDGSMFKQLNGYKSKDFYEEHKEVTLYLQEEKYEYEVAAVYVTNVSQSSDYYNFLHENQRKDQMEYLQQMAAYQLYSTGISVSETDELLSLSTCEYSSTNGRLIVLARRKQGFSGEVK
jgi:sortase B